MAIHGWERKHREVMDIARWIAERKEDLFILDKDRASDLIKEAAWKQVLENCIANGQEWLKTKGPKEKNWGYLRDNKWTMIKSSVRRHLAGNGPSETARRESMDELTNFMIENDILDSAKEKKMKPPATLASSGVQVTIKAGDDITSQFLSKSKSRSTTTSRDQSEDPETEEGGDSDAPQPEMTLSEMLAVVTSSTAEDSTDEVDDEPPAKRGKSSPTHQPRREPSIEPMVLDDDSIMVIEKPTLSKPILPGSSRPPISKPQINSPSIHTALNGTLRAKPEQTKKNDPWAAYRGKFKIRNEEPMEDPDEKPAFLKDLHKMTDPSLKHFLECYIF
ncbi:hypothetical protein L596_019447 [Steinernema carpocapsae]|uniref:Uncharacterized protein n=1 Tax=Steinernema carpocapsae TaxID=34508 RepID=A0A4U5MQJ3_STECR|nr:hypothetical protein L596_019447 [Steinernema carpocapsae]